MAHQKAGGDGNHIYGSRDERKEKEKKRKGKGKGKGEEGGNCSCRVQKQAFCFFWSCLLPLSPLGLEEASQGISHTVSVPRLPAKPALSLASNAVRYLRFPVPPLPCTRCSLLAQEQARKIFFFPNIKPEKATPPFQKECKFRFPRS